MPVQLSKTFLGVNDSTDTPHGAQRQGNIGTEVKAHKHKHLHILVRFLTITDVVVDVAITFAVDGAAVVASSAQNKSDIDTYQRFCPPRFGKHGIAG